MSREINPPDEIARRLAYVLYMALVISGSVLAALGVIQAKVSFLLGSAGLFLVCRFFKRFGDQRLQFNRLAKSFPYGHPEDDLPREVRQEMEELISDFHKPQLDWIQRHDIRKRLERLIKKEPRLFSHFQKEIAAIHPKIHADDNQVQDSRLQSPPDH